jgi:acetylornithine deacetylase/succinyl-diaminopimelate desuccinylase-like protein
MYPETGWSSMTDPVALLSEYVRIDTSNPPGDCREAAELLYGAMEAAVLGVHPNAVVVPYMSTGFTDSRFFRSIGIPTYGLMPVLLPRAEHGKIHGVDERIPVDGIAEKAEIVYALVERWNAAR